jgi:TonB family protein
VVEPLLGAEHPLGLAAIPTALHPRDLRARANQTIPYPLDDPAPTERRLGIATRAEQLGRPPSTELPGWSNLSEVLPELPGSPQARIRPSTRTTTRVLGSLRQRKLVGPLPSIDWTSPEPIQTAVTEIMVNGQGRVISEKLIEPSGNKTADALALEASKRLRFADLEGVKAATANHPSNLVWGRILFQWGISDPDIPPAR